MHTQSNQNIPRQNLFKRWLSPYKGDAHSLANHLDQEQGRLEALVESLHDYILAVNTDGLITIANKPATLLFAGTPIVGRPFDEVWQLQDSQASPIRLFSNPTHSFLQSTDRTDAVFTTPNGNLKLAIRTTPYPVGSRKPQGAIVIIRDVTKQKSLDDQQQEFVSVASHELRTPLAVAEAALSSLNDPSMGQLNDKGKALVEQAYRTIRHLSLIVGDLTTLQRADQGLLDVELSAVEPRRVLKQLLSDSQPEASKKQLELKLELHPEVHSVFTSEFRVIEILRNFVSNAIKYTDKGSITLLAEPLPGDGIRFSVRDTGIGIAAADQPKMFSRFYRTEDYRTRSTEGTGLGLYICYQLAQRLSGSVGFTSEFGKGSTFYLDVPPYSRLGQDTSKVTQAAVQDLAEQL